MPASRSRLLFAHLGTSNRSRLVGAHVHPFWQLEVATRGRFEWTHDGQRHPLCAGEGLLIPAGTAHGFRYPSGRVGWATFKFNLPGPPREPVPRTVTPEGLAGPLMDLLVKSISLPPAVAVAEAQAGLLGALVALANPAPEPDVADPLVTRVDREIAAVAGRPLAVGELARRLGVSPGHLSTQFRARAGRGLKAHIDAARAARATELLRYSDSRVGEIAAELGFADIYAFSRFVRARCGAAPSVLRRQPLGTSPKLR